MSRHQLVRRNPALNPSDVGRVFVRVPQGKILNSRTLRSDLATTLGAGKVYLYWIGDGKYGGIDKKILLCAWQIDQPFDMNKVTDAYAFDSELDALNRLRGNYQGNVGPVSLYQVTVRNNGQVVLTTGTPFNLDRLSASDPDREAIWKAARPEFPIKPEGVVTLSGATPWHGYGPLGAQPYPAGYPTGQPGPYPHPAHTSSHWAGYGTTPPYQTAYPYPFPYPPVGAPVTGSYTASNQLAPQQSLEHVMMDHYRRVALENEIAPTENLGWTGAPRKNCLVSEYVGFSIPRDDAPIAEWWTTRSVNNIDPIPPNEMPVLVSLLWNTLSQDAQRPKRRSALRKLNKLDLFKVPHMIQWRVLEPVQRGDIRYYVCQWKLAYEPHTYETTGNILYKTF